jgi:ribosomal protein S6
MRYYDLSCLILPEIKIEKANKITEEIISFLEKQGAILDRTKGASKITLAYPIAEKTSAYFSCLTFFSKPEIIKKLKEKLNKTEEILRFLIFTKKKKAPPSLKPKVVKTLPKKEEKVALKDLEKKLEEIIGKTIEDYFELFFAKN